MFRLSITLVFTFACAPLIFAQEDHQYEGGGFVGGSLLAGGFQFPTAVSGSEPGTSRTVGVHYASGYHIGARIGENLGDFWAADLEYSFANQPLRFTNLSPNIQSLSLGHSIHHFSYSVSYLAPVGLDRFRPYGKIGFGGTLFDIHGTSKDEALGLGVKLRDSWKFTLNWGGGFKYLVDDQTVLTFDVKDFVSGIPSYGLPFSAQLVNGQYQPGLSRTGRLHNVQLNV